MKILYSADLHGDGEALHLFSAYASNRKDINAVIYSGDLIAPPLDNEQMKDFLEVKQILGGIREKNKIPYSLAQIAKTFMEGEGVDESLKSLSKSYLIYASLSKENMLAQYKAIKEKFSKFSVPVLTLPGNHDGKCLEEILGEENLHMKTKDVNGIKFAGYGGAEVIPVWMPEELAMNYQEVLDDNYIFHSQPLGFLSQQNADIAVVHNPPFGACDITKNLDKVVDKEYNQDDESHVGSKGIASYIMQDSPRVVLAGHIHESIGVEQKGYSYVLNPGNIGRYLNEKNHGTFMEFELDDNKNLIGVKLYLLKEIDKISKEMLETNPLQVADVIAEYIPTPTGIVLEQKIPLQAEEEIRVAA